MLMVGIVIIFSVIVSAFRIIILPTRTKGKITDILFVTVIVICFGGLGLWGFIGHVFASDIVASSIGWPEGNPFQIEVGLANLAVAITAIGCIWFKDGYRVAATLVNSVWLCGAGILHIKEIVEKHNYNIGNTLIIVSDIGIPIIICILLFLYYRENKAESKYEE